jgi:hypothetical protein
MNIEIKDANVLRDGEQVGTIGPDGEFYPVDGLHHKTVERIRKELREIPGATHGINTELQGGEVVTRLAHNQENEGSIPSPATIAKDPEPERTELGDIDTALIQWRKRNWDADAFAELYPVHRLKLLGLEDLA